MAKNRRSVSLDYGGPISRKQFCEKTALPTSKEDADLNCGRILHASKLPWRENSAMGPLLYGLDQEMCGRINMNLPSDSFPSKVIICQYPKVNRLPPQRRSQTMFVRINYQKDANQRSKSCRLTGLGSACSGCFPAFTKRASKQTKKGNAGESWSDITLGLGGWRVPYVNLGYRCDSKEFKEQQAAESMCKRFEAARRQENIRKPTQMIRYDYNKPPHHDGDTLGCFGKPASSRVNQSLNTTPGISSRVGNAFAGRHSDSALCSNCRQLIPKSELQLSVDKFGNDPASRNEKQAVGLCQIVNLPVEIVARREEAAKSIILDSDTFLALTVEIMNGNGFICIDCGSRFLAATMIKQICDMKRMG